MPDEATLVVYMAYTMIVMGFTAFLTLLFIDAPYGRYSSAAWGPMINSKVAWFIQEIPALLVPLIYLFSYPESANVNKIMLGFFIIHYVHRYLNFIHLITTTCALQGWT